MDTTCIVCSSSQVHSLRAFKGASKIFDQKYLKECLDCHMVFIDPMPSEEELTKYNATYFESAHGGHPSNPSAVAFFSGIGKLRGAYVDAFLTKNNFSAQKVLEVGPGHGYFAENWIVKHPQVQYFGVETDESCHDALQQAGVHVLSPEQVETAVDHVDLVIISHVLEHVSNPQGFLHAVTKKLRKGGILFVEVPCFDWQHKELDEPHLLFFDKEPMKLLLNQVGFEGIEVNYYGDSIESLKASSSTDKFITKVRSKLIDLGFHQLFAYPVPQSLSNLTSLERAATRHAMAHLESKKPAWWLRAISIKK